MTNLTPAQLEQFESTFRYFDKDETNTLELSEMAAALASLGIVYSVRSIYLEVSICLSWTRSHSQDEDMDIIYDQLLNEYGAVTFEAFINLLVRLLSKSWTEVERIWVGADCRLRSPKTKHHLRNYENPSVVSQPIRSAFNTFVLLVGAVWNQLWLHSLLHVYSHSWQSWIWGLHIFLRVRLIIWDRLCRVGRTE